MSIPVSYFVEVNAIIGSTPIESFGFSANMLVADHTVNSERISGPFSGLSGLVAAGFTQAATPEIYNWASAVFSQEAGENLPVDEVVIGRIASATAPFDIVWNFETPATFSDQTANANNTTLADWLVLPAADAAGNYAAFGYGQPFAGITLDSTGGTPGVAGAVTWEYWNGSAWTALAGVADGTSGFTAAAGAGQAVTWTIPGDWAQRGLNGSTAYYVRAVSDGNYSTSPIYDVGVIDQVADANLTATLNALYAEDPGAWYITNILTRDDTNIGLLGAWTETQGPTSGYPKIGGWQSADLTWTAGAAAAALGYVRSGGIYHATSSGSTDGYADGAWWSVIGGYDQDAPGGPGNAKFVQLTGVSGDALSEPQANTIWDENGNIYAPSLGTAFTSNGTMASGRKIKQTQTIDWITVRLQEDYLNLLVGNKDIPFTPGGLGILEQTGLDRLQKGVTFGHFRGDDGFEPTISIPDISTLDPESGEVPITASAYFANSVDKVTVTLYLQQG